MPIFMFMPGSWPWPFRSMAMYTPMLQVHGHRRDHREGHGTWISTPGVNINTTVGTNMDIGVVGHRHKSQVEHGTWSIENG
jgi:hypothetical protein